LADPGAGEGRVRPWPIHYSFLSEIELTVRYSLTEDERLVVCKWCSFLFFVHPCLTGKVSRPDCPAWIRH